MGEAAFAVIFMVDIYSLIDLNFGFSVFSVFSSFLQLVKVTNVNPKISKLIFFMYESLAYDIQK
jgi:hypothetical protein